MGGLISGIGGLLGSGAASSAAKTGASIIGNQLAATTGYLSPYITTGQSVLPSLAALATSGPTGGQPNYLTQAAANLPGTMTEAQLEQTPGYQFTLAQGLKATQSAAAARGLGVSGAALKGAAAYASGLADTTYQNQFANQQAKFSDLLNANTGQINQLAGQYSRLQGTASLGEQAGSALGQIGGQMAAGQSNALTAAGAATGTGLSALGQGIGGTVNMLLGAPTGGSTGSGAGAGMAGGAVPGSLLASAITGIGKLF